MELRTLISKNEAYNFKLMLEKEKCIFIRVCRQTFNGTTEIAPKTIRYLSTNRGE